MKWIAIATVFFLCAMTWGQDEFSLEFDGSDDYVDMGSDMGDIGTSDFSIFAWIKPENTDVVKRFASKDGADPRYYARVMPDGTIHCLLDDAVVRIHTYAGNTAVDDGQWHCVGFTFDRDGYVIGYIDAEVDSTISIATAYRTLSSANVFFIGKSTAGGDFFDGLITDFRFYDYVLTASEVATLYADQARFRNYSAWTNNLATVQALIGDYPDSNRGGTNVLTEIRLDPGYLASGSAVTNSWYTDDGEHEITPYGNPIIH